LLLLVGFFLVVVGGIFILGEDYEKSEHLEIFSESAHNIII
jgi:hypothetical protein